MIETPASIHLVDVTDAAGSSHRIEAERHAADLVASAYRVLAENHDDTDDGPHWFETESALRDLQGVLITLQNQH